MGLMTENGSTAAGQEACSLKFLIYGRTGWIGGLLGRFCAERGIPFAYGGGRLENRAQLEADIAAAAPTHVFNAAGVTGRPNVDWCETHRVETIRPNVVGTLTLADVCRESGLILVNYATGCIFEYDGGHPLGSGIGFKEEDTPNFVGSFYSKTKAMILRTLNFITKITRYEKVVNIPNSMTILDELLPISIEMAKRNLTGIWNFTNPGVVSHNEILEMYRDYIDPNFTWKNFTLEEQAKVIVAPRSNNELDTAKLKKEFPELLPIKESLIKHKTSAPAKESINQLFFLFCGLSKVARNLLLTHAGPDGLSIPTTVAELSDSRKMNCQPVLLQS
ncbi:RmlD substrate binding domain [Musa troglodytarum]|uniref:RmlD substrate binding domain n=1 Tax=Musa troglodytarum TaxID=320322 RepID=A0A9E7KX72_9LILI|nr:RmlD substrate binding domain [Musa troglodytarum]